MTEEKAAQLQEYQNQSKNLDKITWLSLLAGSVDAKPKVLGFADPALFAHQTDFHIKDIHKDKLILTFQDLYQSKCFNQVYGSIQSPLCRTETVNSLAPLAEQGDIKVKKLYKTMCSAVSSLGLLGWCQNIGSVTKLYA